MKAFSGFPSGKPSVTPLPNQFFSELLPAIDDLAELKATLHIIWRIANSKEPYIRTDELNADRTLMQSLAIEGNEPEAELNRALAAAAARGTLLKLSGEVDYYFLNNESGRRTFERMEQEKLPLRSATVEPVETRQRPNIFMLYEQNLGLLTPMISEELKEAEKEYSAEWIQDAFKIAVENNIRKWSYVAKILERWKTDGHNDDSKRRKAWWEGEHAKHIHR